MLDVFNFPNPFDIHNGQSERWCAENGSTIRDIVHKWQPGFTQFEFPTLVLVDGKPWMLAEWDNPIPDNKTVTFVRIAGDPVTLIIAIVVAVVAAVVVALVISPSTPAAIGADRENGDPVYTLTGERNQNRLNASIECVYGRNRLWPAYAARPYNVYDGNEQYQFSLFCLGHGDFAIETMYFEDTPIVAFEDVEWEIVKPGEKLDLFADNVDTSTAVSNIELFAPNEEEYSGWTGAFVVNAPFTACTRIEVDIELPVGLYKLNEEEAGKLEEETAEAAFEYAAIDDYGNRKGGWQPLVFTKRKVYGSGYGNEFKDVLVRGLGEAGATDKKTGKPLEAPRSTAYTYENVSFFSKTLKTNTPQRYTYGSNVPAGRYVVRARRTNQKNDSIQSGNVIRWQTLRCFFPSVKAYGGVTLIAIKARATNNLNNNAAARFNVVATRKLKQWSPATGWTTAATATRSPVWAFCDVFMANYGGRLPDTFLALQELYNLSLTLANEKIFFDYIFDSKTTVWEVARVIARVCRGVPMLDTSRLTIIRDVQRLYATAMFNQHNIVAGSFQWSVRFRNIQDYDGVEVIYTDSSTWQRETVLCLIGDDLGDNPQSIQLSGCTDRTRAFQEGLYTRASQLYIRENIDFKTGLEGFLPRYGDMIMVSHDVPKWGTGGLVVDIDELVIQTSEPCVFTPGEVHRVLLRKRDGTNAGPYTVTAGDDAFHIVLQSPLDYDFSYNRAYEEPPYYLFGIASYEARKCTVVSLTPEGNDQVSVRCVAYDERLYSFGGVPTPAKYSTPRAVTDPARPVVVGLQVSAVPNAHDFIQISWAPALGARQYLVEQSPDNFHWTRVVTQPSTVFVMKVNNGILWIRVAGVNTDIGPWAVWSGRVGDVTTIPARVQNLRVTDLRPGSVTVSWNALTNHDGYEVTVFDKTIGRFLRRTTIVPTSYTYTLDDGDDDGLTERTVTFRLKGSNILGVSADARVLDVTIPARSTTAPFATADVDEWTAADNDVTASEV